MVVNHVNFPQTTENDEREDDRERERVDALSASKIRKSAQAVQLPRGLGSGSRGGLDMSGANTILPTTENDDREGDRERARDVSVATTTDEKDELSQTTIPWGSSPAEVDEPDEVILTYDDKDFIWQSDGELVPMETSKKRQHSLDALDASKIIRSAQAAQLPRGLGSGSRGALDTSDANKISKQ